MVQVRDLTGQTFGDLFVISRSGSTSHGQATWNCRCKCGNVWVAIGGNITGGRTTCCGCDNTGNLKHGMTDTVEFRVWCNIVDRCEREWHKNYKDYGGRGIRIHPDWRSDFKSFLDYVGKRPSPKHSIERLDVNKGYEPGNIIWATRSQQANNCRNSRRFDYKGRQMTARQIMDELGTNLPVHLVIRRLERGWDAERAATAPPIKY